MARTQAPHEGNGWPRSHWGGGESRDSGCCGSMREAVVVRPKGAGDRVTALVTHTT